MQELSASQKALLSKQQELDAFQYLPQDHKQLAEQMLHALPTGSLFRMLHARYVSNWETAKRVLHIGTFVKDCDDVYAAKCSSSGQLPSHIGAWVLPQILTVVSIASRLDDQNDRDKPSERVSELQITNNIELVKNWLDMQRGESNVCIHTLQTRTLLLLLQELNLVEPQELWTQSGMLIRQAMCMGLHQDPEEYSEISIFDKDIRRKLWTTIVELDVQFSLASGTPGAIMPSHLNLRETVNIDDDELTEDLQNYPTSKSYNSWTNAMPHIALSASLGDRLIVTNLLGGALNLGDDIPLLLSHAKVLEQALRSLPQQFRASTREGNENNKHISRLFTSISLDMLIHRPLLALYRTIALSSHAANHSQARKGALRSSLTILSHLDALDPIVADLTIVKSGNYFNLFHILYHSDIMQAALLLCHEIRVMNSTSGLLPSTASIISREDESSDDAFPQTKHSLTRVVDATLTSLISRLGDFGSNLKDILILSVVLQSVRAEGTSEEMREVMKRGAERVLFACRNAMSAVTLPVAQDIITKVRIPKPGP